MKKYHVRLSNRKKAIVYNLVGFIVFFGGILLSILLIEILDWPKIINLGIFLVLGFLYMLYVNLFLFDLRNCYLELDEKNLKILVKNEEVIIPYKEINIIELHKFNNLAEYSNINLELIAFNKKTYIVTFFSNKEKKPIDIVLTFLHSLNERVTYTLIDKTGLIE